MFNFASSSQVAPVASDGAKPRRSRRRRKAKGRNKVEPFGGSKTMAEKQPQQGKKKHDAPMTKRDLYFALDCEMVGVGPDGLDSAVGRVTLVNWDNQIVLDTFVQVRVPVTDYRTFVSGITADNIQPESAQPFEEVRATVQDILRGKILIGHGLDCDLSALGISHPWCDIRDTANYSYYMREFVDPSTGQVKLVPRKLRDLAWDMLKRQIQKPDVPHNPVEDCIAALDLYKAMRGEWEESLIKLSQQKEKQRQLENQRRWQLAAAAQASSQARHTTMAPPAPPPPPPPPPPPTPMYHHMGVPQISSPPPPAPPPPPPPARMVAPLRGARGPYQMSSYSAYPPMMQVSSVPPSAMQQSNQAFHPVGVRARQPSRSWFSARRFRSPTGGNRQEMNNNMVHRLTENPGVNKPPSRDHAVIKRTSSEDCRHVLPSTTASTTDSVESYEESCKNEGTCGVKGVDDEPSLVDDVSRVPNGSKVNGNTNNQEPNSDYEPPKYFTSSPDNPSQQALQSSWFSFLPKWPMHESSASDVDSETKAKVKETVDAGVESDSSEYFDELKGAELLCLGAEAFNRESSDIIVLDSSKGATSVNKNADGNNVSQ